MHRNSPIRQTGNGLTSFIVGLLIATIIIAGILYFLNKSKSDFKNPVVNNTPASAPEILTPPASSIPDLPPVILPTPTASQPAESASTPAVSASQIDEQPIRPNTPDIPSHNPATTPNSGKSIKTENPPTVTPEQILESGSIEKALQDTQKKQNTKNKVYLQIGSFNNLTDADAQRAKLVMLGIDSNIATVNIKGNTRYRVVTNKMNQQEANQVQQTLQKNNFDSLTKNAP